MIKIYAVRQGDLAYIKIDKLPKELKETKTNIVLQNGSGGNSHSFKGGKFYKKEDGQFIIGYLKANKTKIYHTEHSPKGDILKDGFYEIRRQNEETINGLKQVID